MKAVVQDVYGSAEVLRLEDIEQPAIGPNEVLVRVEAAGLERGVLHFMTGKPHVMRFIGFGLRGPKARVRGREVAGRAEAVGSAVTKFHPGDEVFGIAEGSFAECAAAREDKLVPKPTNVTFEQAAATTISAITALQAVREFGHVQPGQHVLVLGASGGVGTFAVQLAKIFGAEVTGVCSTTKMEMVRLIGADHVIDYKRQDIVDGEHFYDVIIDIGGNRSLSHLRRALTRNGTLVIVGGEGGRSFLGGTERNLRAALMSPFIGQKLRAFVGKEKAEDLNFIRELLEHSRITPVIDRTFELSEAAKAIQYLEDGHAQGKVVVTVGPAIQETGQAPPSQ